MADPRFKPPNLRVAAKRFAALRAFLGGGRPELSDPNVEYPSAKERARAAYAAETGDVNLNFLRQLADVQPRDAANFIAGLVRSTAENPLAAVAPVPKGGMVAKEMQRRARMKAYDVTRREFDSARMRGVNEFLARQRSGFEANLEPPPMRSTPRREYVIEQCGPRVDVFDAAESAPEQITLEQARAAGVLGPETMPLPGTFRFTRTGPRVDVANRPKVDPRIKGSADVVDGLKVGKNIDNVESISASLEDWQELPGIRRIPMNSFEVQGKPTFATERQRLRAEALAKEIQKNGRIDPLIVVEDAKGRYILEGATRFDALRLLGKRELPALVVRDLSEVPRLKRVKPGK